MNQQEITLLNRDLIDRFGKHQRLDKAIEELIELSHVLTKIKKLPPTCLNYNSDLLLEHMPTLLDEMADVTIMLVCLMDTLDVKQTILQEIVEKKKVKMAGVLK